MSDEVYKNLRPGDKVRMKNRICHYNRDGNAGCKIIASEDCHYYGKPLVVVRSGNGITVEDADSGWCSGAKEIDFYMPSDMSFEL
jgi:hypothetical protein